MALFAAQHLSLSPVLHLDFSNDAGNTVVAGDFSDVVDLSGNGYHATQATAGSRPQRILNGQNGLSFARFGPTDSLVLPNVPQGNGQFVLMIGDTTQTGIGRRAFMTAGDIGPGTGANLLLGHDITDADNKPCLEWDGLSGRAKSPAVQRQAVIHWTTSDDGTETTARSAVDSSGGWSSKSAINTTPLYTTWDYIGHRSGYYETGFDCYEILVLPSEPDTEELGMLITSLVWKWGINAAFTWGSSPFFAPFVDIPPLYYAGANSITSVSVTDTTASSILITIDTDFGYDDYVSIQGMIWEATANPQEDPPSGMVILPTGSLSGPGEYELDFSSTPLTADVLYMFMAFEASMNPMMQPVQQFGFTEAPVMFTATAEGPAATPLTVGGMSQAQQQGVPTVSPAAAVQPTGMAQAQSISDLGLAHTYAVTPSVMRQAHSIEKAATHAASWIVAGSIRQIQRMTGVELTARYPVTAHDAKQGQALNIANLESNYMLAIQTLLQAQGQDEIAIDPNYPLTVAAISQAQGIKAPSSLTANGVLALNHMTQEQTEALVEAGGAIISFEGGHIVVRRKLGRRSISAWHLH